MTTTRKSIAKLSLILLLLTIVVVTWSGGATYSVVAHSHSHDDHHDHHDHHHSDHAAHDHTHSHTDPKSMIKTAITTTTKATAKTNINDGTSSASTNNDNNNNNNSNNSNNAWLYSLGASFFVSLLSFSGATLLFSTMSTRLQFFLTSLAIGSLLGDTFMHMLPAIYGTHSHSHGNSHDDGHGHHEHGEHTAAEFDYGLVILFGFLLCFFSEMIIRYRQNKAEKSTAPVASPSSAEHAVATTSALTHTRSTGHHHHHHHGHIKAFGWLNLFSDAIHNFMDGMGLAGAFQISTGLGIATTLCVCFHELPQELSDFGVLLSAGFSVKRALLFNFLSGVIAVVGCLFGLTLSQQASLLGGSWSNLLNEKALISVTAGSFLYITAGMTQELWSQIFTDEEEHSHEQGIGSKVELSSISKKQKRKDSSASSDQPLPRRKTTTAHGTTSNNTVKSNIVVSVVGLATGLILMRMIAQLEHSIMHAVSGF